MKPKEKAIELYHKFVTMPYPTNTDRAKQCALITVDEILKAAFYATNEIYQFYLEVKTEIEKL